MLPFFGASRSSSNYVTISYSCVHWLTQWSVYWWVHTPMVTVCVWPALSLHGPKNISTDRKPKLILPGEINKFRGCVPIFFRYRLRLHSWYIRIPKPSESDLIRFATLRPIAWDVLLSAQTQVHQKSTYGSLIVIVDRAVFLPQRKARCTV